MEIRKVKVSDYDQVLELYKELDALHAQARPDYFLYREDPYPKDAFEHNLANPICLELGAFEGERLLGIAGATLWNESGMVKTLKTVCLDSIYVRPECRRQGIAARFFAEVERWAKEQGAVRLDLHVWDFNKGALELYSAMGMTPQRHVLEKLL